MSIFEQNIKRVNDVSKILKLNKPEVDYLTSFKEINENIIKHKGLDYRSYRIVHNDVLGPSKGGIRFHPGVSEDEIKSLAFWMSLKTSLVGLPFGGAKGGIRINPKGLSQKDLEIISRKYVDGFCKKLGQDRDIPAPDVYTNSQIMAWMLDQYEKNTNKHEPGMITGKPIELQGCLLRDNATSKGGFIIIKDIIKKFFKNKKNISFAIQGFGNAGLNIAKMLYLDGYKNIVAISDSGGGVYDEKGINVNELINHKQKSDNVLNFEKENKNITNKDLLEKNVDILILAALENQITEKNAGNIKAKFIIELANGPVSYGADKILFKKGINVVPDILANAGGVVVSYFEWSQNKTGNIIDVDYLENKLKLIMLNAWDKVYRLYLEKNKEIDLRKSAYILSIDRIMNVSKLRGSI